MPTTREVEAARVERMRRQAQQRAERAAATPKPRTRAERLEAEHKARTGPRWACRLDGCPVAHIWHPSASVKIAEAEARRHYNDRHYNPEPPFALRGVERVGLTCQTRHVR